MVSLGSININGFLQPADAPVVSVANRAFRYGDAVFESIRFAKGRVCFLEKHISRLLGTMKLMRMEIPATFNAPYFEEQIQTLLLANGIATSARIRLTVYRNDGGLYMPAVNTVSWVLEAEHMADEDYAFSTKGLTVDIYQDFRKPLHKLSNIKSGSALFYVLAAEHARKENMDDCVIINQTMNVVETTSSNLFAVKNGVLYTCPVSEGCVEGIMRSVVIELAAENRVAVYEVPMPMSVMFNSDEVFLTNAIKGVQWVGAYKGKRYFNMTAKKFQDWLNERIMKG